MKIAQWIAGVLAAALVANEAAVKAALAPLNLQVSNDAVSFLDAEAAQVAKADPDLAFVASFVEGLVSQYGSQAAPALAGLEGDGFSLLVAFLQHVASAG